MRIEDLLAKPYGVYVIMYGLFLIIGLALRLKLKGLLAIILGGVISIVAVGFFRNQLVARIVSVISAMVAFYYLIETETS